MMSEASSRAAWRQTTSRTDEGTRELVAHPNYVIVYRVSETTVEIVNVLHARQQYP